MPTYKNNSYKNIAITYGYNGNRLIESGETFELDYLVDHEGFTRISDAPYYNPLIERNDLSGLAGASVAIDVDYLKTKFILITMVTGKVDIYLNDISNTPALFADGKITYKIPNNNQIEKIIFSYITDSELNVFHYKQNIML